MRDHKFTYLIYSLLFVLAAFSFYSNYKNYLAFDNQIIINNVISSGRYEDIPEYYVDRMSEGYPNLSATSIPFNSLLGAYWINNDSIELGFKYLRKGNLDNPHLGYSDMIFANVYQALGNRDSLKYYANEAAKKLPNNPAHFALQGRIFIEEDKIDSLVQRFNEISKRVPDREVWRLYLSAMASSKYQLDTIEVNKNAKKAKLIFPNNKSINLTADYVLYGIENVKKSIELRQNAIDNYEENPQLSIKNINQSISLVPDNITSYEVLIEMLFRNENLSEVISVYDTLNEMNMTNLSANVIEFISISYVNTGDVQRGCYLANILNNVDYFVSPSLKNACKIINWFFKYLDL